MSDENEYANIPVLLKTKKRVDQLAPKAKTYDEFINELLDVYEGKGAKK